jgi:hypothetical protein
MTGLIGAVAGAKAEKGARAEARRSTLRALSCWVLALPLVAAFGAPASAQAIDPATLLWATCPAFPCVESPEVTAVGGLVTVGVAEPQVNQQNNSFHFASAALPPATAYILTFSVNLSTWDAYNLQTTLGTGYWDSFSVSIAGAPYWDLGLGDPITTTNLPGLAFLWGGTNFNDVILDTKAETITITVPADPYATNYLNVGLDTKSDPQSNHNYPSWGTFNIIGILPIVEVPDVVAVILEGDGFKYLSGCGTTGLPTAENPCSLLVVPNTEVALCKPELGFEDPCIVAAAEIPGALVLQTLPSPTTYAFRRNFDAFPVVDDVIVCGIRGGVRLCVRICTIVDTGCGTAGLFP